MLLYGLSLSLLLYCNYFEDKTTMTSGSMAVFIYKSVNEMNGKAHTTTRLTRTLQQPS
jgi:hypothetical protein